MLHKYSLSLLFLMTVCQSFVSAQKLFPGYYIDNKGDSVFCDFRFNDWRINPKSVVAVTGGRTVALTPSDIKGFGVTGYSDYTSKTVTYHKGSIAKLNIDDEFSEGTDTATVFLKILIRDNYSLYELILPERPYYFFSENDGPISELVYRIKQNNMKVDEDQQYKKTLFTLFEKEGVSSQYVNAINIMNYGANSIRSMMRILNEKHSGVKYKKRKEKPMINLDLYAGAMMHVFPAQLTGRYTSNNKLGNAFSPSGGANLLFFVPGNFHSLGLGVSIGVGSYNGSSENRDSVVNNTSLNYHYTTFYHERLTMKNTMLMTDLYAMYFINPKDRFRFFVKGGINLNFSLTNDNELRSDYDSQTKGLRNGNPTHSSEKGSEIVGETRNLYYDLKGALGLMTGRHKFEFVYYSPSNIGPLQSVKIGSQAFYYYYTIVK
jgi:hypothetical protein